MYIDDSDVGGGGSKKITMERARIKIKKKSTNNAFSIPLLEEKKRIETNFLLVNYEFHVTKFAARSFPTFEKITKNF